MANGRPGRPKGLPKTGGRKKGVGDKSTADLTALCQSYTAEAVGVLRGIMTDAQAGETSRVAAAREIIDRGHGKAVQFSEAKVEHRTVARIPMPAATAQEWSEQHAPSDPVH